MKEQFADYETAKMLKELEFNEMCLGIYYNPNYVTITETQDGFTNGIIPKHWKNTVTAPLWQQVEQWLWDKHQIIIYYERGEFNVTKWWFYLSNATDSGGYAIRSEEELDSPITAKTEGIKAAVKYLYEQKLKSK